MRFSVIWWKPGERIDAAGLLSAAAARQAASPTAMAQARLAQGRGFGTRAGALARADSAFDGEVARAVRGWSG